MTLAHVTEFKIASLRPKVDNDPVLAALLPTKIFPESVALTLSNASAAHANAIRRVICDEFPVWCLSIELDDITTNDEYLIPEMLAARVRMIPILQTVKPTDMFACIVVNTTKLARVVTSGEITYSTTTHRSSTRASHGCDEFNETFEICTLAPGRHLNIAKIKPVVSFGYIDGNGMHAIGVNTLSRARDVEPLNTYENTGVPSRISNPKVWEIKFRSHGIMPAREIITQACDIIIARARAVLQTTGTSKGDEHTLIIMGESHTIGNLLMRTMVDANPGSITVTYNAGNRQRSIILRVLSTDDIADIYRNTVAIIIANFESIKKSIPRV